jgi:AcrR family transcriptional regulator/DNA-binding MarR family transcriptional regulator
VVSRGKYASAIGAGRAGRVAQSERLVEIQRARLLAAAVGAIDELGYADTTVSHITARASVSRRTFYELFAGRDECLLAILEDAAAAVERELRASGVQSLPWRERVRRGLSTILGFLDREPALARVCVVQTLRGGPQVLARREELLTGLATVLDEGRREATGGVGCTRLTAEGLVGAAFGIVHGRLLRREPRPLVDLQGELMGMIVLPYLGSAAARRELARAVPVADEGPVAQPAVAQPAGAKGAVGDPLEGVRVRLTYRTVRVLGCVAEQPGASNRMVGDYAGVTDAGQISKLLRRLESAGLLVNTSGGHTKGEPNAWSLTPLGSHLVAQLHRGGSRREAA